ncbi:DNA polymerase III subunit delta [Peribacillus cavernae]|uniref:DNA polymerase III subunit delta n=1 Tax=Peribacillus cavernae TaxID=1674310 RepID=A0A433HWE8_9BACI|nr:DNA polymerase III subunit delta [Peribacillus cavernae]MDQ0218240.1 DNA polymerase-3 subunit delta [Peribacillus cavernae]RUQ32627.1 DNA polymerase III subunit delta [Peribacillus cavernae]
MVLDVWKDLKRKKFAPVYLLYGTEAFLINETKQLLLQHALTEEETDFNFSQYDLEETPIETALEDVETLPFIGERRLVFMQNPFFLTAEKPKQKVEHNLKKLEQYIADPAPYSIVVLTAPYEKLDERKKITKELKRKAVTVEAKKLGDNELKVWIRERAAASMVQIDEDAIALLLELAGTNLMLLTNEIDKMALYVDNEKRIDVAIVEKLVAKSLEQNVFTLVDEVLQKNVKGAISIFHELLRQNEEPIKILGLIASQVRLMYQVKEMARQGYSQQKIAGALRVHPYRVKLAQEKTGRFHESELLSIINELAEADYKMKTGQADKALTLELLLLKIR